MGHIHQVSISPGGVPKVAVDEAVVTRLGIVGDDHHDRKHHGGPDRALCLFSLEVIEKMRAEGHDMGPGHAGDNLTVAGIDWATVVPGNRYRVGDEVEIEITSYTTPCATNGRWFIDGDFTRMLQSRHPGESRSMPGCSARARSAPETLCPPSRSVGGTGEIPPAAARAMEEGG